MIRLPTRASLRTLPLLALLLLPSCSSSSGNSATATDAGTPPPHDAAVEAAAEAGPPPVAEPPWSGMTVEPGCTANGCIHAFAMDTSFAESFLQGAAKSGNPVTNGVVEYKITYVSDGQEVTGTVFYPDTPPPAGGWDVVVMNQFTSGLAPSCAPSAGLLALAVASIPAFNGYVTLVPDGTSQGKAPYGDYLWGITAGRAALDGARAAFHTTQAIAKPIARKAIIAGQSQGAYSTMAAATQYPTYANELEIKGFAAAEPPSNFLKAFTASVKANTVYIGFDVMRLWSWQGDLGLSGGQIFQPPYDTSAPMGFMTGCFYNGSDGSSGALSTLFPNDASSVLSPAFLGYAMNDTWPTDWVMAYGKSQTVPSYLKLPVLIFEGTADTTVLPADADAYVAALKAAGVNVDYQKIAGGTHETTALTSWTVAQLANTQALSWIASTFAK